MKKELKGFIIGVIVTVMLMSTVAFAEVVKQNIEVVLNSVNLTVNGEIVQADNILYNSTTYVPLRKIAEMLDKEVGWDQETYMASINDKEQTADTEEDITNDKYEYVVKDDYGKDLYSFKINKITTMAERNEFSDINPAQVLLIDYTYKNIANSEGVFLYDSYFKVIDSKGKIGYTYPNSETYYPQMIPVGASCDAQMIFGISNVSDSITLYYYKDMDEMTTSFKIPIE